LAKPFEEKDRVYTPVELILYASLNWAISTAFERSTIALTKFPTLVLRMSKRSKPRKPRVVAASPKGAPLAPSTESNPTEKLRNIVRSEIISRALSALLSLAISCAGFLIYTAPARLTAIYQQHLKEAQETGALLKTRVKYISESNDAQKRSVQRMDALKPYAHQIGELKPLASADFSNKLHLMSASALMDMESDKGMLAAYSPALTGLPPQIHQLQERSLADEIAMWESLDDLMEAVRHNGPGSLEAERGFDVWTRHIADVLGDESGIAEFSKDALARANDERRQMDADQAKAIADLEAVRGLAKWKMAGLMLSIISLSAAVYFGFDLQSYFFGNKSSTPVR
jgi:hypothetical protein